MRLVSLEVVVVYANSRPNCLHLVIRAGAGELLSFYLSLSDSTQEHTGYIKLFSVVSTHSKSQQYQDRY